MSGSTPHNSKHSSQEGSSEADTPGSAQRSAEQELSLEGGLPEAEAPKGDLLMRFFESEWFDTWIALT